MGDNRRNVQETISLANDNIDEYSVGEYSVQKEKKGRLGIRIFIAN